MKVLVAFLLMNFVFGITSMNKPASVRRAPLVVLTVLTTALFSRYRWV